MVSSFRKRARQRGSTLAEVLVVTSALCSMETGSFEGAKDKARQEQCLEHLRQLGMAIQMFTMDNDGRLPTAAFFPTKATQQKGLKSIKDELLPYVKNKDMFVCPGAPEAINSKVGLAYLWNDLGNNYPVDQVPNPAATWLMTDLSAASTAVDKKTAEEKKLDLSIIPPAHVGGFNVLYADGHVKWSKEPPQIVFQQQTRKGGR